SDCEASSSGCRTPAENIFDQVGPGGWKGYAQSMPTACGLSDRGPYLARHNPAVYYTDLGLTCLGDDVSIGTPASGPLQTDIVNGTLPTFATLTPDVDNDQHDGTLQQADSYLGSWINEIVAGPDYQSGRLAVAIVYDEGAGSGTNSPSTIPAIFMSQFVPPGRTSGLAFTHYSLLAAAEDIAGVPRLGQAASADNLRAAFGF
ncbi:MAG: alkaline phosphatase family protein, partial [Acidimicrobiales bacterium]